jgi:hypothetical protein
MARWILHPLLLRQRHPTDPPALSASNLEQPSGLEGDDAGGVDPGRQPGGHSAHSVRLGTRVAGGRGAAAEGDGHLERQTDLQTDALHAV